MIAGSFRRAGTGILLSAVACLVVRMLAAAAAVAVAVAVSSICIDAVRMRLLWLSIICFVLFMQL